MKDLIDLPMTLVRAVTAQAPLTGKWLSEQRGMVSVTTDADTDTKVYKLQNTLSPISIEVIGGRPTLLKFIVSEYNIGAETDFYFKHVLRYE